MSDFQYLTPCFEATASCNLDWAAVSAIGGWAAAIATLAAVIVALKAAGAQVEAAKRAVTAEREKAEAIQQREWDATKQAQRTIATQLARAFARELAYAKRELVPKLLTWSPFIAGEIASSTVASFAARTPLNDLVFLRSCADRLQGFDDRDAFLLLSVLTTWQFFNQSPGVEPSVIEMKAQEHWREMAYPRVKFGLDLLDLIDSAVEAMERYSVGHAEAAIGDMERLTARSEAGLKILRAEMAAAPEAKAAEPEGSANG